MIDTDLLGAKVAHLDNLAQAVAAPDRTGHWSLERSSDGLGGIVYVDRARFARRPGVEEAGDTVAWLRVDIGHVVIRELIGEMIRRTTDLLQSRPMATTLTGYDEEHLGKLLEALGSSLTETDKHHVDGFGPWLVETDPATWDRYQANPDVITIIVNVDGQSAHLYAVREPMTMLDAWKQRRTGVELLDPDVVDDMFDRADAARALEDAR